MTGSRGPGEVHLPPKRGHGSIRARWTARRAGPRSEIRQASNGAATRPGSSGWTTRTRCSLRCRHGPAARRCGRSPEASDARSCMRSTGATGKGAPTPWWSTHTAYVKCSNPAAPHSSRAESRHQRVPTRRRTGAFFFPHLRAQRATQWERGDDPMTTVSFLDGYDDFGRARDAVQIALPRRSAMQRDQAGAGSVVDETRVLATATRTHYAAPDATVYPRLYIHDRTSESFRVELAAPPTVQEPAPDDLDALLEAQRLAALAVRLQFSDAVAAWPAGGAPPATLRLIGHLVNRWDGAPYQGRLDGLVGPGARSLGPRR